MKRYVIMQDIAGKTVQLEAEAFKLIRQYTRKGYRIIGNVILLDAQELNN